MLSQSFVLGQDALSISLPAIKQASTTSSLFPTGEGNEPTLYPTVPVSTQSNLPVLKPWEGTERVTVLIMGLDYRDWSTGKDYPRSDTMILLTLDPSTKTAGIVSIPRDMWVPIPGFKHGKINTAYYLGEAYKFPGGGPELATKTVEQFLGVPVNYYAQIDFAAFVRFIDEIFGVEIDVQERITIDLLGDGSKTKKTLQPGRQVLPGEWALAYARARYTEEGDFDRARRQQQVIMAIRDRLLDPRLFLTLIQKAPTLYRELISGINTNLALDDVLRLALLAKDVNESQINQGVFGKEYVIFGFTPDNLSILIPIPDKIHTLRDQIFPGSGNLKPLLTGSKQDKMVAEAAKIVVLNGTQDQNLANRTAEYLRLQNANIVEILEADRNYPTTTIIDHTGNPYTLAYLTQWMNVPFLRIYSRFDSNNPYDIELILGSDWASRNTLP